MGIIEDIKYTKIAQKAESKYQSINNRSRNMG